MLPAVVTRTLPCVPVCSSALPNELISEAILAENSVQQYLEIVASCWIAVEVQTTRGLEHAPQLHEPRRHHNQVGHQHVSADEQAQRRNHLLHGRGRAGGQDNVLLKSALGLLRPLPYVGEGLYLSGRLLTRPLPEPP